MKRGGERGRERHERGEESRIGERGFQGETKDESRMWNRLRDALVQWRRQGHNTGVASRLALVEVFEWPPPALRFRLALQLPQFCIWVCAVLCVCSVLFTHTDEMRTEAHRCRQRMD